MNQQLVWMALPLTASCGVRGFDDLASNSRLERRLKRSTEFAIPPGLLFSPPSLNESERGVTVEN